MAVNFVDLDVSIPVFNKPNITFPSIRTLQVPDVPPAPSLQQQSLSTYDHNIEAIINSAVSEVQTYINNTLSALTDSVNFEIEADVNSILNEVKLSILKIQERYYSELRSLRDKYGALSDGIPSGSMLYAYHKLIETSIIELWSVYINAKRQLLDIVRRGLASALDKLFNVLRIRDQISDEIARTVDRAKDLDITKQTAIVSNIIDYHNALVDLYVAYAESKVLAYNAQMNSLLEAQAKAMKILSDINSAEIDNSIRTIAQEVILLNIDRNVLQQRLVSLQMYEDVMELEEYEAILSKYNADIRKFSAEVDKAFMPYRVFSRQIDATEAQILAQSAIAEADRINIGVARLLMDADFDIKSATYDSIRGELNKIRGEIAKKEADIRKAIDRAEAELDMEYFSKLMAHLDDIRSTESSWIDSAATSDRLIRAVSTANDLANKLYRVTTVRDVVTGMRTDASHILGAIDKAGEIVRANVVGCAEVTAEIIRTYTTP